MELVSAVISALRNSADVTSALGSGAMGVGHLSVPSGTKWPYIVVHGGDGGVPSYAMGNSEVFADEIIAVEIVTVMTETESPQEAYMRVRDLVRTVLSAPITISDRRILSLRRSGGLNPGMPVTTQGEMQFSAGDKYEAVTSPE